jgi:hypothetical protein
MLFFKETYMVAVCENHKKHTHTHTHTHAEEQTFGMLKQIVHIEI